MHAQPWLWARSYPVEDMPSVLLAGRDGVSDDRPCPAAQIHLRRKGQATRTVSGKSLELKGPCRGLASGKLAPEQRRALLPSFCSNAHQGDS